MRRIGSRVAGGFGVAMILLALIGTLAYLNIRSLNANIQLVVHTHLVIENLEGLISSLTDAETGQRGFIITGNSDYLTPYNSALTRIDQRLLTLRQLTQDNPNRRASLDRLQALAASKLAELRATIALRKGPGGFQAARARVMTNRGMKIMREIRALVTEMEQAELALLAQRSNKEQASVRILVDIIVMGIPIAFIVLGLLAFMIIRSMVVPLAELSAAAQQIAADNLSVEIAEESRHDEIGILQQSFRHMQQRIQERTTALEASYEALRQGEEQSRLMVESVKDYAIILLDPNGLVTSWNAGAERIKGYHAEEIIGKPFTVFYTPEDIAGGKPQAELRQAVAAGRFEEEGWRVRKDGSRFWANVVITPLYTNEGALFGFVKITRDISERRRTEEELLRLNADLRQRTAALEVSLKEMETFSYSVAHDLRSPLRSLDGFSKYLLEHAPERLNPQEQDYLHRMRMAAQRMARLIDDLLNLARIGRIEMHVEPVNLSDLAVEILAGLRRRDPERQVITDIAPELIAAGDRELLRIALEHLLENAWKFTNTRQVAHVAFGVTMREGKRVYFVRDDGVGFAMAYVDKLFQPFQRLHTEEEFPGTGIGLALTRRIMQRHGGRIWAEADEGHGATFYFTLGEENQ